jgi:hypothetical protein
MALAVLCCTVTRHTALPLNTGLLRWTTLYFTLSSLTALCYTALLCSVLHYASLCYTALHCTSLRLTAFHAQGHKYERIDGRIRGDKRQVLTHCALLWDRHQDTTCEHCSLTLQFHTVRHTKVLHYQVITTATAATTSVRANLYWCALTHTPVLTPAGGN